MRFQCTVVGRVKIKTWKYITLEADSEEHARTLLDEEMEGYVEYEDEDEEILEEDDDEIFVKCLNPTLEQWQKNYNIVRSVRSRPREDTPAKAIAKLGGSVSRIWSEMQDSDDRTQVILVPGFPTAWQEARAWHITDQDWYGDEDIVVRLTAQDLQILHASDDWEPHLGDDLS